MGDAATRDPVEAPDAVDVPSGRYQPYEEHLALLIQAANQFPPEVAIPEDLLKDVARLLHLFDEGLTKVVGQDKRRFCRVVWIVAQEHGEATTLQTHNEDGALAPNEEQAVVTCYEQNWFVRVANVKANQVFEANPPERMVSLICARNLGRFQIGLVIALDEPLDNFEAFASSLLVMIALMMPLWDLDLMRRLMLNLTQEHVREAATR